MGVGIDVPNCQSSNACPTEYGSGDCTPAPGALLDSNCARSHKLYYNKQYVYECEECINGTLKKGPVDTGECGNQEVWICSTCGGCVSDTDWIDADNGYMKKSTRQCKNLLGTDACMTTKTEYQCAAGYYGNPTSATSGCTKCPSSATGVAGLSPAGATSESQCYINAEEKICDDSGCFKCSANYEYVK